MSSEDQTPTDQEIADNLLQFVAQGQLKLEQIQSLNPETFENTMGEVDFFMDLDDEGEIISVEVNPTVFKLIKEAGHDV